MKALPMTKVLILCPVNNKTKVNFKHWRVIGSDRRAARVGRFGEIEMFHIGQRVI
jgi:hypothetical protein